jgi:sugar phosphate isomerase/epimerase
MAAFRVGIDSYCLHPLALPPSDVLEWAKRHGGEGVQFSEVNLPVGRTPDAEFLSDLRAEAQERGLYLEWGGGQHVPFDTETWRTKDLLPGNRRAAEQAHALGAWIVRSCSGGFFRWSENAPSTGELLRAMAAALRPQRQLFRDLDVVLAIELHFEFTTFELVRLFEMCDAEPGDWLGVCLDTFNMLPMLEDPVAGTERILPWVVATHVKDGALRLGAEGLQSFPTELGKGLVDLDAILDRLAALERPVNLSVEDHGGEFTTCIYDSAFLRRFPDLTAAELGRLIQLAYVGGERLAAGEATPTDRAAWPSLCQGRTERDLAHLRRLVDERAAGDS